MNTPSPIDWLTNAAIEAPLRTMFDNTVKMAEQWTVERLVAGGGDAFGVWRIGGSIKTTAEEMPWSMVLKGWDSTGNPGPPSAFNWRLREAELYSSGVLNGLTGVSAPASYGSVEREGTTWVWLEDLTGIGQPEWTIDEYVVAARALGRFNGSYISDKEMPEHKSLSHRWLAGLTAAAVPKMSDLDDIFEHPVVVTVFPPHVAKGFFHIWDKRESILEELDALPQTFCHLDAFHRNIFFRGRVGNEEMVLVDWSYAGKAAIGEELAALCVAGATINPKMPDNFDEIERVAFEAYIQGLSDMGWKGAEERIWHAYRSAALLRYGPSILHHTLTTIMSEEGRVELSAAFRIPIDRLQDHLARVFEWIANHADEI